MVALCPSCHERQRAWLDYRAVPGIRLIQIGTSYQHVLWARVARYQDWADLVTAQQELIARLCREGRCGRS